MSKKIRWITETAVMLALLVSLQAFTKPMGQLVTGSCVNAVLAVSALVGGLGCGLTVALISPLGYSGERNQGSPRIDEPCSDTSPFGYSGIPA